MCLGLTFTFLLLFLVSVFIFFLQLCVAEYVSINPPGSGERRFFSLGLKAPAFW